MKKKLFLITTLVLGTLFINAQNRVFTKSGKVEFNATAPSSPENIVAHNQKATSVIDLKSGAIQFAILMKAFYFEKALMQEHFNENYVESDKFPKTEFRGTITNFSEIDLQKDNTYKVTVKGDLILHGVTKNVEATGEVVVKGGTIVSGISEFAIQLSDFNIEVPSLVKDKLNKEAKIKVDVNYEPMKSS